MVVSKTVTLTFPVQTVQMINYTLSSYLYYNLYFPQITADGQIGTEINLVKTNNAPVVITAGSGSIATYSLFIGTQGSNVFFSSNGVAQTNYFYMNTYSVYAKFVAIKNASNQYGWLEIDNNNNSNVSGSINLSSSTSLGGYLNFFNPTNSIQTAAIGANATVSALNFDILATSCANGWIFSKSGTTVLQIDTTGSLTSINNIYSNGTTTSNGNIIGNANITAGGNITATGSLNATGNLNCNGVILNSSIILANNGGSSVEFGSPKTFRIFGNTSNCYIDYLGTVQFRNMSSSGDNLSGNGAQIASNGGYSTYSDESVKKNFRNLTYGLKEVLQMAPMTYHYKSEKDSDVKSLGLIAQHVLELIPELVSINENDGKYMMNYTGLIPVLIKAIQEQNELIIELTRKVEKLADSR